MANNLTGIYNNIMQLLAEIEKLNNEYKNLEDQTEKDTNSNKIDEIEAEIYSLETLLLNDYDDSYYFFQVVNYKKWLIQNGTYTDNIDFLNKKINLSNILTERIAHVQSIEVYGNRNALINGEAFQSIEAIDNSNTLDYGQMNAEYEQQQLEYEQDMQRYNQEMLEYENSLKQNLN